MPLQAAIVDLDGTLIDTVGDFDAALNAVLADLRLPPVDRAFITRTIGKGSEHLIRSTLAELGADAALYDRAWAWATGRSSCATCCRTTSRRW